MGCLPPGGRAVGSSTIRGGSRVPWPCRRPVVTSNLACAFPGGFGTFDELFEVLTLTQTRKVRPMPVVTTVLDWPRGRFARRRRIGAYRLSRP